jgi:hypothetical protein
MKWLVAIGVGLLMLCEMFLNVPALFAQAPGGAFEQLSPGNQKIARALFEAQPTRLPPGTSPLTLDQIAARKLSHQDGGWGRIFADMRTEGRVTTKNLGQAVSSYNHRHHVAPVSRGVSSVSRGPVTTAANRSVSVSAGHGGRAATVKSPGGNHGKHVASVRTESSPSARATTPVHGHGGHGAGHRK